MRNLSFSYIPLLAAYVLLIRWFIFVGSGLMNISCKGDVEYAAHEFQDEFNEISSEGILHATQGDGKSIGEKLSGEFLTIFICVFRMI